MKKGFLITFEGGEGAGKTTLVTWLKEKLEKQGKKVVTLREPGGTKISDQIREVVLSTKNEGMAFAAEVFLFQAARSQIYEELVLPALKRGEVILMDRSRDSSVVYQGVVRKFGKKLIEDLNNISTQDTKPDLTILLDVTVNEGLKRRGETDKQDRLDLEKNDFHKKVRKAYLQLAKDNQDKRWVSVDANQQLEKVQEQVWDLLKKKKIF